VVSSGRTDSGVHASAQVAHFVLDAKAWDPEILRRGLNALLPHSIRVLEVIGVSPDFHAQKSASKKQYSYYFQQGPSEIPSLRAYSWWIRRRLDLKAMVECASALLGRHEFKVFQASGSGPRKTTVREILEAEVTAGLPSLPYFQKVPAGWTPTPGSFNLIRVRIVGAGFLKQMVRAIAGTLLRVGEGKRPATSLRDILASQDRTEVGPTAPSRGLWLEKVWYPGVEWSVDAPASFD